MARYVLTARFPMQTYTVQAVWPVIIAMSTIRTPTIAHTHTHLQFAMEHKAKIKKHLSRRLKSNASLHSLAPGKLLRMYLDTIHVSSFPRQKYAIIFFQVSNLIKIPFTSLGAPCMMYELRGSIWKYYGVAVAWQIVCFIWSRRHHVFESLLLSITEGNSISCRILCSKLSIELTTMICLIVGLEPNSLFRT